MSLLCNPTAGRSPCPDQNFSTLSSSSALTPKCLGLAFHFWVWFCLLPLKINDWSDSAHSFCRNGAVPVLVILGDHLAVCAQPLEGLPFRNTEMRRKDLVQ